MEWDFLVQFYPNFFMIIVKNRDKTLMDLRLNDNVDTDDETMTLKSVQVFFRHGARTPLSHLPNVEEVKYICIA